MSTRTRASSGRLGYTLAVHALSSTPGAGAQRFFGSLPKVISTNAKEQKVYIRKAGTIKIANIYTFAAGAGTNEAWTLNIRLNDTTNYPIATVAVNTQERVWSNTALNIPVVVGDYIEIQFFGPAWSSVPTSVVFGGYIYIE